MLNSEKKPLVFIISGPAGVGKTTLCDNLKRALSGQIVSAITTTTRFPREGERHGIDYYFSDHESFKKGIEEGAFCEYSVVHGNNFYGLTFDEVQRHFDCGYDILLNMDIQGALKLKSASRSDKNSFLYNRVVSVFILPPSMEELRHRLERRHSHTPTDIEIRLATAKKEIEGSHFCDYYLPVEGIKETLADMLHIYYAEKMRNRS